MDTAQIKRAGFFIVTFMMVYALCLKSAFSEDQSAGFYAGPLSAVAETVAVKSKPVLEEVTHKINEALGKSREGMKTRFELSEEFDTENPLSASSVEKV